MSPVMPTAVLASLILVMYICHCEITEYLNCEELPRIHVDNIEVLVANGPFTTDFTLTSLFECSIRLFTHQTSSTSIYDGTFFQIKGSEAITYDYHFDSDTKTAEMTTCGTGEKYTGHVLAAQFGKGGSFFCTYSCNNTELKGFSCSSNSNGTSPAELAAFEKARKVSNGHLIYNARKKCPPSKGCKLFY